MSKKEKIIQQSNTGNKNKVQNESYDIKVVHKTGKEKINQ